MDYTQAMKELAGGLLRPIYLLHGEETFLTRKVERAIIEAVLAPDDREMGLTVRDKDPGTAELKELVETYPFMGGKNLVIIRGTQLFRSGRKAEAETEQEEGRDGSDKRLPELLEHLPEYSHLVFVTTEAADKRRRLYKTVERIGAVVDLSPIKAKDLRPWIAGLAAEQGKKLAGDAAEYFLAAVSLMPQVSLGFLEGELTKAVLYAKGTTITRQDLAAVMASLPEISVFAMIEALSQKQTGRALGLLRQELAAGENAIRLLNLLVRQVRMLWQAHELAAGGLDSRQIAETLGVPPFVGEKLLRQSRGFSKQILEGAMTALAAADRDLKLGRTDAFALEEIIINMCRGK